jgi:hypothetical protein
MSSGGNATLPVCLNKVYEDIVPKVLHPNFVTIGSTPSTKVIIGRHTYAKKPG